MLRVREELRTGALHTPDLAHASLRDGAHGQACPMAVGPGQHRVKCQRGRRPPKSKAPALESQQEAERR